MGGRSLGRLLVIGVLVGSPRGSAAQATLSVSKSNECTMAPRRLAARLKSPLPHPMSRNVRPARLGSRSICESDSSAWRILVSSIIRRNCCQFLPKANRSPRETSSRAVRTGVGTITCGWARSSVISGSVQVPAACHCPGPKMGNEVPLRHGPGSPQRLDVGTELHRSSETHHTVRKRRSPA